MMKKYDVAIIGAGTAGLTARREVAKKTDNYVVIDDGPMGTTCARIGCMPSKVLIQVANDFHRRYSLEEQGIQGHLEINRAKTMNHVRNLRDRFVRGVKSSLPEWEDKLIRKRAKFIDKNTLDLGDELIKADKIIIATGSSPIIPAPWKDYQDYILTTDQLFEINELPETIAVIGLGVIGIELGQALNRLGVNVIAAGLGKEVGGVTEPELQDYIIKKLSEEMPIYTSGADLIGIENGKLKVQVDNKEFYVDKAIVAVGRSPNLKNLNLESLNIKLNKGLPSFSSSSYSLTEAENIYLVGDVNAERPILHEAADEGFIAGHNAVNRNYCFKKRPNIAITFADPNIATIGKRYKEIVDENKNFVTGFVSFEGQGRSIVKLKEKGMLKIFADKYTGEILGSELFAPDGEHLAHLIAWGMAMKLTVDEMLTMPFYHPVVEEGLRTALRDAKSQLENPKAFELFQCSDTPIR
jgi:dihydrolipoamide dehydrogenase